VTTPITNLQGMAEMLLSCLCNAVAANPNPPLHCCFRIGEEVAQDADIFGDLCCQGLAYVTVGEIFPVINNFPDPSPLLQANQVCSIPSWAISMKMGIIRCSPVGTDTTMPSCTDWNAAFTQQMYDAQSLATAACCFKESWQTVDLGMSVVIGSSTATTPQGGCSERSLGIQAQTTVCPEC
jgi:hypothetical protein